MAAKTTFISLLFLTNISYAQLSQRFDSLFTAYHKNGLFDGTALIADDSGIVYQQSFGFSNQEHKIPNKPATVFRLGSLEKQFTAMLIMQLVEKGHVSLTGKISDYLPLYRKDIGCKVTIEQLLAHTSGIPNYTAFPNVWNDSLRLCYEPSYILKQFCSRDLEFEPGTKFKYNNSGYFILGQIIEKVTGKPLSAVIKENILTPADMVHSGLEDHILPDSNKATGYYRLAGTYVNEPYIYVPNTVGFASIYSTAYDLYLWDRTLYTNKLLSNNYLRSYLSALFKVDPEYSYGFGWEHARLVISVNDTVETMEHSGAIRAFRSNIFRITSERKCIILLSNCANQSSYDLFSQAMKIFRIGTWDKPGKLLTDTLYNLIRESTSDSAIEIYRDLKLNHPNKYNYSSSSLEHLGERLLILGKYAEAAAIFQLSTKEFPSYTNGYFYEGRAYEKLGKRKEAIKAYNKAVLQNKSSRV
ncbi:serine hydrolase domain-containing protein [Dyadobacter psychrotolerans]|uniref:Tetratricopeptide repeat protein n=1 Tax=Dyadobacter psychrotolerans TaxID=2541721 RepID=A0A4R5DTD7_9BACT|nr:serine hydrolase domain-containing protein [Dyadobacter psychrotolerans]TDE17786.1 tetratricopeptide repeat protein [Dyadobacter psychrotolerans]